VIYNLCKLIINVTVVNADWKEVWYNAVKRNWTITYFISVYFVFNRSDGTRMMNFHPCLCLKNQARFIASDIFSTR
jgi:hypothetical protein